MRGNRQWFTRARSSLLATVALTVLLAGCGGGSTNSTGAASEPGASSGTATQTPLDFTFSFQQGTTSGLLFYIAKDKGFYSDEGLNVELLPTSAQTGTLVSGIASGSLDGALTALATVATTRQRGVDVKLQGAYLLTDRILIAPTGSSIPKATGRNYQDSLKALAGKVVGVPGVGGAPNLELNALLKSAGVDPASVHFIDVEPGTPTVAALKSHSVDAAYVTTVAAAQAISTGLAEKVLSAQENGPKDYGDSLLIGAMVADDYFAKHPDFSMRFQQAMDKAVEYAKDPANLDSIVKIATDNQVAQFDGLRENLQSQKFTTTLSQDEAAQVLTFMTNAGIIKAQPPLTASDVIAPASLHGS